MQNKILDLLKTHKDAYLSGEELSKKLGVSRTAIWKHIENLRKDGYGIDAHPHLGYKLIDIPDKLFEEEITYKLKTKIIGRKIYSYQKLDSTNNTAYRLAEDGAGEGAVVVSEEQSKGKGRMGRQWSSPAGVGIYMSVILRPDITPNEASEMTLIAALSVAKAVRSLTALECQIKWPNDCMVDGKKICGILTEMKAEQDTVSFLVLGIGINVNTPAALLPKTAASIKGLTGEKVSRIDLARKVLEELDGNYQLVIKHGFGYFMDEWEAYTAITGKRIKVACHEKTIEGIAQGIDGHGALMVRLDNGFLERVLAGDVVLLR